MITYKVIVAFSIWSQRRLDFHCVVCQSMTNMSPHIINRHFVSKSTFLLLSMPLINLLVSETSCVKPTRNLARCWLRWWKLRQQQRKRWVSTWRVWVPPVEHPIHTNWEPPSLSDLLLQASTSTCKERMNSGSVTSSTAHLITYVVSDVGSWLEMRFVVF